MQGLVGLAILGVLGWLVIGWLKPPEYTAYFYYDLSNLDKNWSQSGLKSLDECRDWVGAQIWRDFDGEYDYECGKNCEYKESFTVQICDTTER